VALALSALSLGGAGIAGEPAKPGGPAIPATIAAATFAGETPEARAEAIRDWLSRNAGMDAASPGVTELSRRLAQRVDARGKLAARAVGDLAQRWALYQELADAVAGAGFAADFRDVMLKYYASQALDPYARVDVEQERAKLAAGKAGRVVRIGQARPKTPDDEYSRPTASGLVDAVKAALPDWPRLREISQKLVLDYIASLNPGVSAAGSYRAGTHEVKEEWEHLAMPIGGGEYRIWLYHIEPGAQVLIPDPNALRRAADPGNLELHHSWITDLNVLDGLKFDRLDITSSGTADFAPLRYHNEMKRLKAQKLDAKDISPLEDLPLEELDISRSRVSDLSGAKKMPLARLDISHTPVADLSPLAGRPIAELDISNTAVKDLSPLAGMPLKRLRMNGVAASDLTPLAKTVLVELEMADTPVKDLGPLAKLPLVRLDASGSAVVDISPLAGSSLEELDLSRTGFRDLASLHKLRLSRLYLAQTKVADVTGLRGLKLELLDLNQSAVKRLAPLLDVDVKHLGLCRWTVLYDDVELLRKHPTLKTMGSLRTDRMSVASWLDRHKRYGPRGGAAEGGPCAAPVVPTKPAEPAPATSKPGTVSCEPQR
jgi:hypothetical protein